MATIQFTHADREWQLTDEHSASSYGIPVLIDWRGEAYGPEDSIPADELDPQLPWLDFGVARLIVIRAKREGALPPNAQAIDGVPHFLGGPWL